MPVANTTPATLTDLLFGKADVGLWLVEPDGSVIRAVSEWLRATGFAQAQIAGQNFRQARRRDARGAKRADGG